MAFPIRTPADNAGAGRDTGFGFAFLGDRGQDRRQRKHNSESDSQFVSRNAEKGG
jgi:hypothetical protein